MVQVIDEFHPTPDAIKEHARASEFIDWEGPDGVVYKRICITEVPALQALIEAQVGPVDMLGMGYRLNYNGEGAAIHSDVGWGTHALVMYLSEGEGGTAFWRHKETGREDIVEGDVELFERVKDDWLDIDKWEQTQLVEMKYNRALIYESKLFHSRYPLEAFGNNFENGRLIVVAFFTPHSAKVEQKPAFTLRPAEEKDLRRIVEMSERFYPNTSYWLHSKIPFSANHAAVLAEALIENGVLTVAEVEGNVVGMIGLILMPFMFNPDYIHAGEIIWWVEPEYWNLKIGEALLDSIDKGCKEKGARHIQMIDLANSPVSAGRLLEKKGYVLTERSYTKVV